LRRTNPALTCSITRCPLPRSALKASGAPRAGEDEALFLLCETPRPPRFNPFASHLRKSLKSADFPPPIFPKRILLEMLPAFLAGCFLVWWLGGYWGCQCRGEDSLVCSSGASGVVHHSLMSPTHPLRSRRALAGMPTVRKRAGRLSSEKTYGTSSGTNRSDCGLGWQLPLD
jgi:hypothetical protein